MGTQFCWYQKNRAMVGHHMVPSTVWDLSPDLPMGVVMVFCMALFGVSILHLDLLRFSTLLARLPSDGSVHAMICHMHAAYISVHMFLWITHGRDERAEIILCESWEWWGSCAWNMCRYYPWQPTRMMLCIFTNLRASYISRRSHFSCRSMQFHLLYGFSRKFHPHLCNSLDIRILNLFSSLHWLLFYFSSSLHAGCSVKYGCSHCGCRGYALTKWGVLSIICYITSIHPVWKKFLESFWKYKFGATIATTPSPECGASC